MGLLRRLFGRLRLHVNEAKSAVDLVWNRRILGYSFWTRDGFCRLRVADKALVALKDRIRHITGRLRGRSMNRVIAELREYLPGWRNYFSLATDSKTFVRLDKWIRHRLRTLYLKQWKHAQRVYRELRARGASARTAAQRAAHTRRWWATGAALNGALPNSHFDALGLPRLVRGRSA
jgi:hypothetical protein